MELNKTTDQPAHQTVSEEQKAYARLLAIGMKASMAVMIAIFVLYVTCVKSIRAPLEDLPNCWGLTGEAFLKRTGIATGWGWLGEALDGHYLNYLPIIMLSSVSCLCYLRIIPILAKKRDFLYVAIAIAEVVIVALAASGILKSHH
jgi:hypothetical protein